MKLLFHFVCVCVLVVHNVKYTFSLVGQKYLKNIAMLPIICLLMARKCFIGLLKLIHLLNWKFVLLLVQPIYHFV